MGKESWAIAVDESETNLKTEYSRVLTRVWSAGSRRDFGRPPADGETRLRGPSDQRLASCLWPHSVTCLVSQRPATVIDQWNSVLGPFRTRRYVADTSRTFPNYTASVRFIHNWQKRPLASQPVSGRRRLERWVCWLWLSLNSHKIYFSFKYPFVRLIRTTKF